MHQLDSAPEAAENEPWTAALVEYDIWIDRVPIVRRLRFDDSSLILPGIVWRIGIQCDICRLAYC